MSLAIISIEDDDIDFKMMSKELNKQGFSGDVIRAKDGEDGLNLIKSQANQRDLVVLLDLNLPKLNGIEILQELRANAQTKNIIVFVLTTSKADEDRLKAYEYNVAGFLSKESKSFSETVNLVCDYVGLNYFPPLAR